MDFSFSEDQTMLRDLAREILEGMGNGFPDAPQDAPAQLFLFRALPVGDGVQQGFLQALHGGAEGGEGRVRHDA